VALLGIYWPSSYAPSMGQKRIGVCCCGLDTRAAILSVSYAEGGACPGAQTESSGRLDGGRLKLSLQFYYSFINFILKLLDLS